MGWHGTDVRSFVRGILDLRSAGKSCLQTMLGGVGGGGPMTASRDVGGWDRVRSSATTAVVVIS